MLIKLFWTDEHGAAVVDWVALTAGILILGMAVIMKIFEDGVSTSVQHSIDTANEMSRTMQQQQADQNTTVNVFKK